MKGEIKYSADDKNFLKKDKLDVRDRILTLGSSSMSDKELICAILGSGIKGHSVIELAEKILEIIDDFSLKINVEILEKISGIGRAKACTISAALELGRRLYGPRQVKIESPKDAWSAVQHWADRKHEYFICSSLNGAHELIASRVVSMGLVNRTIVHPREVFADPITDRACAVIIAHNHPSGQLLPSIEDKNITARLLKVSQTLGIAILDHIIFSREGFFSFVEHGLMQSADE